MGGYEEKKPIQSTFQKNKGNWSMTPPGTF